MMRKGLVPAIVVALSLLACGAAAEQVAGLTLHIQKLDPGVVRVWVGDYGTSTATVAVATSDGVVVLDTTGNPLVDRELRGIIARELGRDDFRMLINTHEHLDHTGGNEVYADCRIVGHELVAAGLAAGADRQRTIDWCNSRIAGLQGALAKLPPDSLAARKAREQLVVTRLNLEAARTSGPPTPPTRTFRDRKTVKVGDTTFELYYTGGMHTASDIAIFVPEHGLLLTGDTMADAWLSDTPGCLASFIARPGVRHDFPLLLENWDRLLARKGEIRRIVTGHWNGEISYAGFAARVGYVRTLWEGMHRGIASGKGLDDLQAEYRLDKRFPELVNSPGFNPDNNAMTIAELWTAITKQQPGSERLYALIDEGAGEGAIREVLAGRDTPAARYFFQEAQLNAAGYRFLQADRVPQAIAMFRLNTELFPASWNVYDSLGEALLKAGDREGATRMYEKSLALNPESASGKAALARLREQAGTK